MALLDTLAGELLGPKSIGELSKNTGASKEQTKQLVTAALPLLLSGMYQNSTTKEGAQSLDKALNDHAPAAEKSTSSMLSKADAKDGAKIVKHILGADEKGITKELANSTGMSQMQVSSTLSLLAPVLLSLVGNHKNEETPAQTTSSSGAGLASLLGTALLGNGFQQTQTSQQQGGLNLMSLAGSLLGATAAKPEQTQTTTQTTTAKPKKPKKPKQEQQQVEEQPQQSSGINLSGLLMGLLK